MTKKEFLKSLQIVADMGDKQIETLANLLIDFVGGGDTEIGFKKEEKWQLSKLHPTTMHYMASAQMAYCISGTRASNSGRKREETDHNWR